MRCNEKAFKKLLILDFSAYDIRKSCTKSNSMPCIETQLYKFIQNLYIKSRLIIHQIGINLSFVGFFAFSKLWME